MHNTVEPQFKELLQNKVLEITNGYLYPNKKITKPRYNEQILSVPWPFVKSRFHFNAFSFDKVDIFTRFGLAFILKQSNRGSGKHYRKRSLQKN